MRRVRGLRICYASMSKRQQQHKADQQAARHTSSEFAVLLSSTMYTEEREINAGDKAKTYIVKCSIMSLSSTIAAMIFL